MWAVIRARAGHEVAQELADFVLLTQPPLSISWPLALAFNFCVGLTCVFGGLLVTAVDISNATLGLILAAGAGSYIYLGATVSLPYAVAAVASAGGGAAAQGDHGHGGMGRQGAKHMALVVLAFVLGAVAIGLILLDHEHCDAGGAHAGHNH